MSDTARSIYITSPEGETGKSTIALGVLDLLVRKVQRVGVFRLVTRAAGPDVQDYVLELLLAHDGVDTTAEQAIGVTYEDVHADQEAALSRIVARYHEVASQCDFVVVVGTDYTDVAGPTELSFNARVAANLGAPVLLVVSGKGRTPDAVGNLIEVSVAELRSQHAQPIGVVANRVQPDDLDAVRALLGSLGPDGEPLAGGTSSGPTAQPAPGTRLPGWAVPEDPFLDAPTVRILMEAVGGTLAFGEEELLAREATDLLVGAMSFEHLLDRLTDGAVVITPGDRVDILIGLLAAHSASGFPSLAGVILNGGFFPPESTARLVADLDPSLPIIRTDLGTFRSASAAASARGRVTKESQRKVDTALALFEQSVDGAALLAGLDVPRPEVVTPLMFEYELLSRARADRKHVVLPEGDDDRILRAASTLLGRQVAELTILGEEQKVRARAAELGLDIDAAHVVSPHDPELVERFAAEYQRLRAHKGMTLEEARERVQDVSYFGTMMVHLGLADGMVSGAKHTTAHTIKPSFEIIKTQPGVSVVSSCSSCACRTVCSSTATARSSPTRRPSSSRTSRSPRRRRRSSSASTSGSRCCRTRPASPARGPTWTRCAGARRSCASAAPTCSSRARSSTTRPSTRPSRRRRCRARTSRGARPCSSSRTSTRATTPTRRSSARRAPSRWARSSRASTSR